MSLCSEHEEENGKAIKVKSEHNEATWIVLLYKKF